MYFQFLIYKHSTKISYIIHYELLKLGGNMSARIFLNEDLFFGSHLYNVSWTLIFKEATPLLTAGRRHFVLMVAGGSTINPLVILSWLIINNNIGSDGSDVVFRKEVSDFAQTMLTQYIDSVDMEQSETSGKIPPKNADILKVIGEDNAKVQRFVDVFHSVSKLVLKTLATKEIDLEQTRFNPDHLHSFKKRPQKTRRRENEPQETLILPYLEGECWNIGNMNSLNQFSKG